MARFAVTIVSPPGYVHSAAFQEVGESLLHGLTALGHDAVLGHEAIPGRRAIVLGSNLLPRWGRQVPADAILYNLEQIEPGSPWLTPALLELFRRHEVWDYSERNAARYGELGLPAPRVVPIGWVPELTRIPAAPAEDIDVLFYGSLNPRRIAAIEALIAAGLKVEVAYEVFGAARDALIARSKVVLNLHYYEAKVFEVVRVSYLLANRRCVVSERGADPAEERAFEAAVAFAPYDGLVAECRRLARDPAERARRGAAGLALMARRDVAAILHPVVGGALPPRLTAAATAAALTAPPTAPAGSTHVTTSALPTAPPLSLEDVVAMAAPAGKRILSVGCGDGEVGAGLLAAGAAEVVGLDPCARGLTRSRLTATYRLAADAAPELPYPDGYFDVLLVEDLSALQVPGAALLHLRRWLSDQGRLVAVAHNGSHEAALTGLLSSGTWPASAGRGPLSIGTALEAVAAAGFRVEDDVTVVRTEPGAAAEVLRQLCEAMGADPAKVADGLTMVRVVMSGRPAQPLGPAAVAALPDPWRGSRPVKVLLVPDLSNPADPWAEALAGLARGLSGNTGVTIAVALPLPLLSSPPQPLQEAVEGAEVDLLLTEAPVDDEGWARLLAGASTWVVSSPRPELAAQARLVGVDVQRAG